MPLSRELLTLLRGKHKQSLPPDLPKPRTEHPEYFEKPLRLASEHLRPWLDIINNEVLNGRGKLETSFFIFGDGEHPSHYRSGWSLTWDRNGRAGRRLELGVCGGLFHMIYAIHGLGCPILFSSLEDLKDKPNENWEQEVEQHIIEVMSEGPHNLEYGS